MKIRNKRSLVRSAIAASLMMTAAVATAPAALAQNSGPVVPGLAVATLDAVVANSNAFRTAETQRQTTYKPQLDQAQARQQALQAQLQPLVTAFNTARQAANPNQQALQTQAAQIQQLQETGQNELNQILAPVALSRAYVNEQIEDKLNDAVKNAMQKKNISLLLNPEAVLALNNNAYNLNQDILAELNTLIPAAQLVPPQGWEPRQIREARAAQAAAQGQQQPAAGNNAASGR